MKPEVSRVPPLDVLVTCVGQPVSGTYDLLVWGLDKHHSSQETDVMLRYGCIGRLQHEEEGNVSWCTAHFPTWAAADACAKVLEGRFSHLAVYTDITDWQAFGKSQTSVRSELIQLAEHLGCRSRPHLLPRHEAVSLARGAAEVLAALELAGGVQALAAADPEAAACLCRTLMDSVGKMRLSWLPGGPQDRMDRALAALGPSVLQAAVADMRLCAPESLEFACMAIQLVAAFLQAKEHREQSDGGVGSQAASTAAKVQQRIAADCFELLRLVADQLLAWIANVSRTSQQLQQQQQPPPPPLSLNSSGELLTAASVLSRTGTWLLTAARRALECMQAYKLCSAIDGAHLLNTLGQLIRRVVTCVLLAEQAAAAGLWPPQPLGTAPASCVVLARFALASLVIREDKAAYVAAMPALRVAITRAMCIAADHFISPQHIQLLLHVSMTAHWVLRDGPWSTVSALLSPLARILQGATCWLSDTDHPPDTPPGSTAEGHPTDHLYLDKLTSSDQVALLFDVNAEHLATAVKLVLTSFQSNSASTSDCCPPIFDSGAFVALAAALQVTPADRCTNVRSRCWSMVFRDGYSSLLAPGLFLAADTVVDAMPCVTAAAEADEPWAGGVVTAMLQGGLGAFWLAHAEAAAQAALPATAPGDEGKQRLAVLVMRGQAANIIAGVTHILRLPVMPPLAQPGLVASLLQVLPWRAVPSEPDSAIAWKVTMLGTNATAEILMALLAIEPQACAAALRDGSWDVIAQRLRGLQPPLPLAAEWNDQRDRLLLSAANVLEGSKKGCSSTSGDAAATDADAVAAAAAANADAIAAAERAMQELLAEEQPAAAPSQRSRAAAKRARKKAARQRDGPQAEPADVEQAVASSSPDVITGAADAPAQQLPAALSSGDAAPEWCCCALSGQVMRDPVLCGSEGHSFEREALEQWLAANPGVHPLSRQPLPPGRDPMLPNHALRNMIQQLGLD